MDQSQEAGLRLQFRGSRRDFDELQGMLTERFGHEGIRVGNAVPVRGSLLEEQELGQVELIEILVHFSVSVAAHLTVSQLEKLVSDFRRNRRSVQVTVEESSTEGE